MSIFGWISVFLILVVPGVLVAWHITSWRRKHGHKPDENARAMDLIIAAQAEKNRRKNKGEPEARL